MAGSSRKPKALNATARRVEGEITQCRLSEPGVIRAIW